MPTESGKPLIAISYSHADEPEHPAEGEVRWLSFVTDYLRPAIKSGAVELWLDRHMPGGEDWRPEIERKLRACDVFILLVSRHSLSSDYVVDREIPIIRERQRQGERVHFYPILLTPTPKAGLDLVRDKNFRPRDGKPLSAYPLHEREGHMSEAADEIEKIAAKVVSRAKAAPHAAPSAGSGARLISPPEPLEDKESLERWLSGQSREVAFVVAARAALRVAPCAVWMSPDRLGSAARSRFASLTAAIFRAAAVARVAGKYPTRVDMLSRVAASAASEAATYDAKSFYLDNESRSTASLLAPFLGAATAASLAAFAVATPDRAASDAAFAFSQAAHVAEFAVAAMKGVDAPMWDELDADLDAIAQTGAAAASDRPLWSDRQPDWASQAWSRLQNHLPRGDHWEVWTQWYEERLRGGSRGEAYELAFADVPSEFWQKGPGVANAWIKVLLPVER
jgi:hypothetical protein